MTIKEVAALLTVFAGIVANLMFQDSLAAAGYGDWQLGQLHAPTPTLLAAEAKGRVTIFDGINVSDVDRALDGQFDRIESMMFVRTRHPVANGGFYEEADCD